MIIFFVIQFEIIDEEMFYRISWIEKDIRKCMDSKNKSKNSGIFRLFKFVK